MTQRAERLKALLAKDRRTADQAQTSYLATEDRVTELATRERERGERDQQLTEPNR
jgi:hypothetical protein